MKTLTLFALFASSFFAHSVSAGHPNPNPNPKLVKIGTFGHKTIFASAADHGFKWLEAKQFCTQHGLHLASIQSQSENEAVRKFVVSKAHSGAHVYNGWLGATDLVHNGVWAWTNGERFYYKNWEAQPRKDAHYNCAYMQTTGKWSASYCYLPHRAICQRVY